MIEKLHLDKMEKKYKIIHDRPDCIGCGACVSVTEKFWKMEDDGKATALIDEFEQDEYEINMEAAESCPVNVIHILDRETNKKLI